MLACPGGEWGLLVAEPGDSSPHENNVQICSYCLKIHDLYFYDERIQAPGDLGMVPA
jgi:hypothetical protein